MPERAQPNRYGQILGYVFLKGYRRSAATVDFNREDLADAAQELGVAVPKNLGDIVYSYRYRSDFPPSITDTAPAGQAWIIVGTGDGKYRFQLVKNANFDPNEQAATIKIQDSTPGIIAAATHDDEQAVLARVRYNRLVDTFLKITGYSLQNHLRTKVPGIGQIEVDELYLGVDRNGAQYVVPVQAKGRADRLSAVQVRQDIAFCEAKFPDHVCRPVGAHRSSDGVITMMEFRIEELEVVIVNERRYRLVGPSEVTSDDLRAYRESGD